MRVFMIGGKPILFDMVANILGFSVLMFSGFLPVRYFGWLISLTMLTVGIATLLLMPALIAVFRPRFLMGRGTVAPTTRRWTPRRPACPRPGSRHSAWCCSACWALRHVVSAQAPTGKQIIERNDAMRTVDDEQVELQMQLINKRGQKRERRVSWVLKNDAQRNQKALLRFVEPADVRGTALLSIEHADREDDQWLYLPALQKEPAHFRRRQVRQLRRLGLRLRGPWRGGDRPARLSPLREDSRRRQPPSTWSRRRRTTSSGSGKAATAGGRSSSGKTTPSIVRIDFYDRQTGVVEGLPGERYPAGAFDGDLARPDD